jgi:hypothetical protein
MVMRLLQPRHPLLHRLHGRVAFMPSWAKSICTALLLCPETVATSSIVSKYRS